jgi:hypothetical protein
MISAWVISPLLLPASAQSAYLEPRDTRYWMLDARCLMLDTACLLLCDAQWLQSVIENHFPLTGQAPEKGL